MKPTLLFSDYDLHAVLEGQKAKLRDVASKVPSEVLLGEGLDHACEVAIQELQAEPIELNTDEITVEQSEASVDVSRDPMRFISDRGRPFYIDGVKVTYFVPYSGDRQLFQCRPNHWSMNPPYAIVGDDELKFEYSRTDGEIAKTKGTFEKNLASVQEWLGWMRTQLEGYNESLVKEIRPFLEARLNALSTSQSQLGDLGFKVRARPPETVAAAVPAPTRASHKTRPRRENSERDEKEYDVALSFAGEDREYVQVVADLLRAKGVNVFYDDFEKVKLWGRNLVDHLGKVYEKQSRFIVMFISKYYAVKSWPTHERKSAQARAVKMQEDCILPARFDDTEIPGMPSTVAYVDLQSLPPQEFAELIIQKLAL